MREVAQRDESVADLVVGNREDRMLRLIENLVGLVRRVIRRRQDLVGRVDQPAEGRFLLDDARVVLNVGRARDPVDQRGDVGWPADFVELARPAQLVLQRDEINLLANAARALGERCLAGAEVNVARLDEALARNPILATALNPVIGYERAAAIAKKAYAERRPVLDVALEMSGLPEAELRRLLDPSALTRGGLKGGGGGG